MGKGQFRAIESTAGNPACWPRNNFHALNREIGPALGKQAGNRAVSTTNIEHTASPGWNQRRQRIGKNPGSAAKDQRAMAACNPRKRPRLRRRSHRIGNAAGIFRIL